jgi:quinol monooxygenase YgiN|tara:strand:- start:152 stop:448 length:297 start_codon:yes stop_codon:yes gene_type:complete
LSQTIHVEFPCNEGLGAGLVEALKTALVDTRAFDGCESIEVYVDADQPDTVILWEKFATRAHHEAYLAWRVETGLLDMLAPILAGDPKFTYLDNQPGV